MIEDLRLTITRVSRLVLFLIWGGLAACNRVDTRTAVPSATATLIACDERTVIPTPGSILPVFTPSQTCELERAEAHVDFCMIHASDTLAYPCSQFESVQETAVNEGGQTRLIQHDYHYSAGCWTATTTNTRSLRACDKTSGVSTILAENIFGELMPSPDGQRLAFVAAEPEKIFEPHIFQVQVDGTEMVQLDVRPFPLETVPGIQIIQWSEDEMWLEVSLWDGHENGHHRYRLRTDGSGKFEALP